MSQVILYKGSITLDKASNVQAFVWGI